MSPINPAAEVPAPLTRAAKASHECTLEIVRQSGNGLLADLLDDLLKETEVARHALQGYRAHEGRIDGLATDRDNLFALMDEVMEANRKLAARVAELEQARPALVSDWQGC